MSKVLHDYGKSKKGCLKLSPQRKFPCKTYVGWVTNLSKMNIALQKMEFLILDFEDHSNNYRGILIEKRLCSDQDTLEWIFEKSSCLQIKFHGT